MRKSLIAFVLTVCMLCSTACSETAPESSSAPTTTVTTTTTTAPFTPMYSAKDYFETLEFHDDTTEQTIEYLFHEPMRHSNEPVPLVIYLHCLGDTVTAAHLGTATSIVHSLMAFENRSAEYSTYTLVPSTPSSLQGNWTYPQVTAFKTLLRDVIDRYNIDTNRIYLSGLSMGGFMTCQLVSEMPGTFAAAVPLSGSLNLSSPSLSHGTAFRIYHVATDPTVHVSCARSLYQQLTDANHPNVEYVEYAEGTHLFPVYDVFEHKREEFFPWLFSQRLHIQ